ncbi:LysM peptidoglycan-binding domain-containing protein [Cellulosilyticum sp. WCF-2]|nr:LysM peptidoglycan-binding domain-containing protein [Cellulosilyticum sp. WCF-2]
MLFKLDLNERSKSVARSSGKKVIKLNNARRRRSLNLKPDRKIMVIAIVIATILGIWLAFRPNAYEISINGEVIGAIKDIKVIEAAKETVIAQLRTEYQSDVKFEDDLELRRYRAKKRDYIDPTYLISSMRSNMQILVGFKEIYVEGEPIGIVTSEAELETLKTELKKKYYGDKAVKVEFGKKVELKDIFAKEADLISMEKLVQKCTVTTPKSISYEVQSGDTLSGIANKYNTTIDSIISANPEFTDKVVLRIGQAIKVNINEPLLPLKIVKEEVPAEENKEA